MSLFDPVEACRGVLCLDCFRELCSELDAYYGIDPWLMFLCERCRRARERNSPPPPAPLHPKP